ncbi:MAG TPA: hypothetical protein ENI08_03585, partial [Candidatus Dependentiae bacterium]|nr:hypothetical protein [Candidatus Dependentiae bacterium]
MKKEFLYMLSLAFVVCLSSDTYSMEVGQVKGEVKVGTAIFSWQVKGNSKFCDHLNQHLAEQKQSFIIPLPEDSEKSAIQIDPDGRLSIHPGEHIVVRNQYGKIIIDTSKNQEQINSDSMDESLDTWLLINSPDDNRDEDIEKRAEKLQPGYSLTAFFPDNSKVSVTFDSIVKSVSKIDKSEHPARWPQMAGSTLISGAMRYGWKEKIEGKIKLKSTEKEIKTFIDFVESNEEGRKKLLSGLPIFEHIMLAADLHMYGFSEEFGFNFSNFTKRLLKNKIHDLLQKNKLAWIQKISSWLYDRKMKAQRVIEEVLREIIKPVPKILLKWEPGDNVDWIGFVPNEKMAEIKYKNDKVKIINIEDGAVIFKDDNVAWIEFSSDGMRAGIIYTDGRGKIIDTEDGTII